MSSKPSASASMALSPSYAYPLTQAEYEDRISQWGCMPCGFLYRICDGPNAGLYEGSGSSEIPDIFIPDSTTLPAIIEAAVQQALGGS